MNEIDKPSSSLKKFDVLIVDDREENLLALDVALGSPNYNLVKATSGDQALRYLLDHSPALILMDVQMPALDGFETAALIKQSERTREIPIIFITAINTDERFIHQGYKHGAVDYIYKPYDTHILKSKVEVFIELAQKNEALLRAERQLREGERRERDRQIAMLELRSLRREQTQQKKYLDLVDGIDHAIVWSANAQTLNPLFVGSKAEIITGFNHDQWVTEKDFIANHTFPADLTRVLAAMHEAQQGKGDVAFEHRFITAHNKVIWLHTGMRLASDDEGTVDELRCLSVDITRLKEAEDAVKESKNRSDFLAEASLTLSKSLNCEATLAQLGRLVVPRLADYLIIDQRDEHGEINSILVTHSDSAKADFARSLLERYPVKLDSSFGSAKVLRTSKPELYPEITDKILERIAHNEDHLKILKELQLKSGMIVPLIARGKVFGTMRFFSAESGRHFTLEDVQIAEDLSLRAAAAIDNAQLYEQSQAAIRVRDEFLSIASHELQTPLTPLRINTQGLMRLLTTKSLANVKPEKFEKLLQMTDRQISKLSRLIDDMLDISRISSGKFILQPETFDLKELVYDITDRFSNELLSAGSELRLNIPEGLLVHWDRLRIEQVIINLLGNAIKYGAGKPVTISVNSNEGRVQISIQDEGIGIAKKDQNRIFGRFERAVSNSYFAGLGLGLYIVTQILEAHGGNIRVESELQQGSTFIVDLPLQALQSKSQSAGAGSAA